MSLSIDSRTMEGAGYGGLLAEETLPTATSSERLQGDNLQQENVDDEADKASERVSNRFLHSDENLDECQTDDEDEDDDDENDEDVSANRQAAFLQTEQQQQQQGAASGSNNNDNGSTRLPHQWANRQLHRSVSVDDLMEYQREFRLEEVGRASSAYDLTDYQREFQAILAQQQQQQQQQHDGVGVSGGFIQMQAGSSITRRSIRANSNDYDLKEIPALQQQLQPQQQRSNQRHIRNSIANSDLAEFKRQFCQERAARTMRRANSADDARILKSKDLATKLNKLKDATTTMNYQWGTRSLRRAILGSDLGTFERSVRTALLESSRENSSSGSIDSSPERDRHDEEEDDDDDDDDDDDVINCIIQPGSCDSSTVSSSLLGMNHRDSEDLRRGPIPSSVLEAEQQEEEDWGTRSLRKSLKELDLTDPHEETTTATTKTTPPYRPKPVKRVEPVQEEELELPLDANISSSSSPWKDDEMHPSSNGLKMPRRVTSGESAYPEEGKTADEEDQQELEHQQQKDNIPMIAKPSSSSPNSRSVSLNDIGATSPPLGGGGTGTGGTGGAKQSADEPEFEWQLRSRFRRSISSSDIEKYQRHFDGPGMDDDSGRLLDSAAASDNMNSKNSDAASSSSMDDRSAHTVAVVESIPTTAPAAATLATVENTNGGGTSGNSLNPLLAPASHPLISADDNQSNNSEGDNNNNSNVDLVTAMRPPRRAGRRRHRRSTSDEPELHMENVIADVAPRKPTRTTSRPISPPPPRSAVVRFADHCTQVVEIPKVSEDMKPYLFYTKRDVKRFRMNEHRRQEEQIRSYMEYLNQKENALDASPCIFD